MNLKVKQFDNIHFLTKRLPPVKNLSIFEPIIKRFKVRHGKMFFHLHMRLKILQDFSITQVLDDLPLA